MAREYVEERNGGYYVAGTRVSLDSIVHGFLEGLSPEAILEDFDTLTLEQVYGAIAYYLASRPAMDAYLVQQKQRWQEMKRAARPLPEALRRRLEAARQQLHADRSE